MPESRTAHLISLHFTENKVKAASALTAATDFSSASEAAFAHGLRLALAVRGHFYLVHAENLDAGEDGAWAAFPGVRSTLVRWGLLPVDADPAAVAVYDRLAPQLAKAHTATRPIVRALTRPDADI